MTSTNTTTATPAINATVTFTGGMWKGQTGKVSHVGHTAQRDGVHMVMVDMPNGRRRAVRADELAAA